MSFSIMKQESFILIRALRRNLSPIINSLRSLSVVDFIAVFLIYFFHVAKFLNSLNLLKNYSFISLLKKNAYFFHLYNGTNLLFYWLKYETPRELIVMYSSLGEIIDGFIALVGSRLLLALLWNSTIFKSYGWLIFFK